MSIFGIQFNLMKIFTFIALTILPILCFSQKIQKKRILGDSLSLRQDAKKKALKNKSDSDEISIKDYVFFNHLRDSSFVDTTLTIHKDYKFNYLRKDNFNLISFGNLGQTYNTLSYDLTSPKLTPEFGARARHFNYMEIEDINYFSVPTPLTEIMYKTGFTQGQVLDALFSTNISRQFNFSIAYKGMRSLGKYQHTLTSTGNFRFTSNYFSKNSRYKMFGHVVMQDLMNEENGGLTQEGVENFTSGNEEFKDRSVFSPQFENAESMLRGRRYFLNHNYNLLNSKDSLSNSLEFGQKLLFEDKYFHYVQNAAKTDLFGEAYSSKIDDKVTYEDFNTSLYVNYNNESLGKINLDLNYNNYNYGYNAILITNSSVINNRLKGDLVKLSGNYFKSFGDFNFKAEYGVNLIGDFEGHYFSSILDVNYKRISGYAKFNINSEIPKLNQLLNQSDYVSYNWDNSATFNNVNTTAFELGIDFKGIFKLNADYRLIDNYTYFTSNENGLGIMPMQDQAQVNYLRVKVSNEFHFGKFSLENILMYQKSDSSSLNVPELITRNTLYYSNHFFEKKALFLQTGVTFNFFTKYNMDGYDPVLAEFYVQNDVTVGGFPRFDFFINAKVRQTRIYLKAEHFNSSFTGFDYFSAPSYPYRDFIVRFGLVWNFFL